MSGGGTAGHIYPAIALAHDLLDRNVEVIFAGTPQGLEATLVPQAGLEFVPFRAHGFVRSKPWSLVTALVTLAVSTVKAWSFLRRTRPNGVVGFGGYVSIPVGIAAWLARIPLTIHEQNSVLGMTNRFLASRAQAAAVTYPQTVAILEQLTKAKVVHTGNPVRNNILMASRPAGRSSLQVADDAVVLLVFGGSRGARHLNQALLRCAPALLTNHPNLVIIHAAGQGEYDSVRARYDEGDYDKRRYQLVPYLDEIGNVLAASDVVVCRAGATTIAELTALGVASILVPYPYATEDHQTANASAMVENGAALLVADGDLESDELITKLDTLLADSSLRASMAEAAHRLGKRDASKLLADVVIDTINNHSSL